MKWILALLLLASTAYADGPYTRTSIRAATVTSGGGGGATSGTINISPGQIGYGTGTNAIGGNSGLTTDGAGDLSATGIVQAFIFQGSGALLTGVVTSTLPYARLTGVPSQLTSVSNSTGNLAITSGGFTGTVTASTVSSTYSYGQYASFTTYAGNGSALTGITASSLPFSSLTGVPPQISVISNSSGNIALTSLGASGIITASTLSASNIYTSGTLKVSGTAYATNFVGDGSGLTNLPGGGSGNVSGTGLSPQVALWNTSTTLTGNSGLTFTSSTFSAATTSITLGALSTGLSQTSIGRVTIKQACDGPSCGLALERPSGGFAQIYDDNNGLFLLNGGSYLNISSNGFGMDTSVPAGTRFAVLGNITGSGFTTSGVVTSSIVTSTYAYGQYASFTNIAGALSTASQPNITSHGTLTSLNVSGQTSLSSVSATGVSVTGNASAAKFIGDGSLLTNLPGGSSSWSGLSGIPAQVIAVSNSTYITMTSVDVTGNLNVSTVNNAAYPPAGGGGMTISATQNIPSSSIAVGFNAGSSTTSISQTGSTIFGMNAMTGNNQGMSNTVIGAYAFNLGGNNTNTTANTVIGSRAMGKVTTVNPSQNVVIGEDALANVGASSFSTDVYIGNAIGAAHTTASNNVAIGQGAITQLTGGGNNVAIGHSAMNNTTTGNQNVAVGDSAGGYGTGTRNVALGYQAMTTSGNKSNNTTLGYAAGTAISTGGNNTFIGSGAGANTSTGSSNIAIGMGAVPPANTSSFALNIGSAMYGDIGSGTGNANKLGINVTSPTVAFEVSGTISGTVIFPSPTTAPACSAANAGQMIYNNGTKCMMLCNGTSFVQQTSVAGSCT